MIDRETSVDREEIGMWSKRVTYGLGSELRMYPNEKEFGNM